MAVSISQEAINTLVAAIEPIDVIDFITKNNDAYQNFLLSRSTKDAITSKSA